VTLQLFGHSFSAYTRKALIALDEKGRAYDTRMLGPERSDNSAELARRGSPIGVVTSLDHIGATTEPN
jgi:glutathione S-transferase